ncbi:MAG: glycosyltransferase family 4 protein [Acidobacteriota bacterium]
MARRRARRLIRRVDVLPAVRILIVSNTYPPADISGVGSLVHEMAHRLGADGHTVRVLTRRAPADDPYAVSVGGKAKVGFVLSCGLRYLWLLRRERYDLIHVHESDGFFVVWLWWLQKRLGRPSGLAKLVATLQVSYDQERRMVRPVKADGQVVSRPSWDEHLFYAKSRIQSLLGRFIGEKADAVVAPSRVTLGELEEDYGVSGRREVIYNGISLESSLGRSLAVAARTRPPQHERPTVLYVGRLRTRKAVAVLLMAMHLLRESVPGVRLLVVGDGEQIIPLATLRDKLKLPGVVQFLGKVDREKLALYYREADVYCLPSLYEGFPLAILEAMAAGLPVVATRVSGNPEAVVDGETGYLVPEESAQALAEALERLLTDPVAARAMGERGRERLLENFTIDHIATEYRELWEELLAHDADDPAAAAPSNKN